MVLGIYAKGSMLSTFEGGENIENHGGYKHLIAPDVSDRLLAFVDPIIVDLGYVLVRISMMNRLSGRVVLQIMVDGVGQAISVDDCAKISRRLSVLLDVEDIIQEEYMLEVSSPGIDRPLCRPADFEHWVGYEVKIGLRHALEGQKRFRGLLEDFVGEEVRLKVALQGYDALKMFSFNLSDIAYARLVTVEENVKHIHKNSKRQ